MVIQMARVYSSIIVQNIGKVLGTASCPAVVVVIWVLSQAAAFDIAGAKKSKLLALRPLE